MTKILLPTDFSEASLNAIQHALHTFSGSDTEFVLLQALGTSLISSPDGWSAYGELMSRSEANLQTLIADLKRHTNAASSRFRTATLASTPELAIDMLLRAEPFDWVVLGATGTGKAIAFGSVATAVIRANRGNVLVIPATVPPLPLLNAVFATDYAPLARAARYALHKLVERHHARLTFLTILAKDTLTSAPPKTLRQAFQSGFQELSTTEAIESHTDLRNGIENYLESHYVDLLVTVCHHRSLIDLLLNRSTTRQLAYKPMVPLAVLVSDETEAVAPTLLQHSLKGEVIF
ncbi:universal stress protein [Spirosoma sp. SC4-14]|uniref:universal stress protein n=1 Tax=Spirosoma sp. SC4-14 TaxID=3128900 RepID=UPI0030CD3DB9